MAQTNDTVICSIRMDKKKKKKADKLFKGLGMNTSTAVNIFINQCLINEGLPFAPSFRVPSKELLEAIEEVKLMEEGKIKPKVYDTFEEAVEDILNDDTI